MIYTPEITPGLETETEPAGFDVLEKPLQVVDCFSGLIIWGIKISSCRTGPSLSWPV